MKTEGTTQKPPHMPEEDPNIQYVSTNKGDADTMYLGILERDTMHV